MTTKTTNVVYWICTIVFAGLMIFSSIGGLQPTEDTIKFMHEGMGFPVYFIQFISYAKIVGCIAILIPGLPPRVKEWAYAGLFFDLIGAVYSGVAVAVAFDPMMLTMLAWFIPGIVSYYLWIKKIEARRKVAY